MGPDPDARASASASARAVAAAADRHPRRVRAAPAQRRQPAEGGHRALGRERIPDAAVLRRRRAASTSAPSIRSIALVREFAAAGSAVLLFTSELPEIRLACDRAIVLFGGRIVDEMPAERRPTRRPCCAPRMGSRRPSSIGTSAARGKAWRRADAAARARAGRAPRASFARTSGAVRHAGAAVVFLAATVAIHPNFNSFDAQSLAMAALPLAFAAAAQAIVVISGGIDLSIGSVMAVCQRPGGEHDGERELSAIAGLAALILVAGARASARSTACSSCVSRVPDVIVTLTTGFIWGGVALLILEKPGGGAPDGLPRPRHRHARSRPGCSNSLILLVVVGRVDLAAGAPQPARAADLRRRQRPHRRVPQRRRRRDAARVPRLCPRRPVQRARRPRADDDDRHRLAARGRPTTR